MGKGGGLADTAAQAGVDIGVTLWGGQVWRWRLEPSVQR